MPKEIRKKINNRYGIITIIVFVVLVTANYML